MAEFGVWFIVAGLVGGLLLLALSQARPKESAVTRYNPRPEDLARIENDHTFHCPLGDQALRYTAIRAEAKVLALGLLEKCPPSRELSLALTAVDETVFWAIASIARHEQQPKGV